MKISKFVFIFVFLLSIPFTLISCAGSSTSESTGQYIDSSTITTKVKGSLLNKLGAKSFGIKVKSFKDEVQLSGFVDTQDIKSEAGEITSKVKGVGSVVNDLIVKGAQE